MPSLFAIEIWEWLSYVVTVIGLPVAIVIFTLEQRKERANEEDEIQQLLSDSYSDFLKVVIENADLRLLSQASAANYDDDQRERALALYDILISIFERAYIMGYTSARTGRRARHWRSWEDIMIEWCGREDFRALLPTLLIGEDEAFAAHMRGLAEAAVLEGAREVRSTPRRG